MRYRSDRISYSRFSVVLCELCGEIGSDALRFYHERLHPRNNPPEGLFPAETFMETIEVIASGFVDDDHILDTDSADGFAIQTGFDRNDITGH